MKPDTHGNRGSWLEAAVLSTAEVYDQRGIGCIVKMPTPVVQVTKKRRALDWQGDPVVAQEMLWVRRRSTVDFFGVLHRLPVAFEAKTTQQRLFRLDKITQGQLAFLERFVVNSGCGFVLLNFDVPRAAATFVLSHRWLVQAAGSNPDGQLVTLDVCRAADAALQPCVQVKHGEAGVPIHFAPGVLELHHRMGQHAHEQASA